MSASLHDRSRRSVCIDLPPATRRQAGFTLVEMAVATVVLLVVVVLACDLLTESGRLLHHSVERAQDPWTLLAAELLRNDIRAGTLPPVDIGVPTSMPLQLGPVVWSRNPRGELVRQVSGDNPHAYLQHVRSFRWRTLTGNAVEVTVSFHESSTYLHDLAGALPHSDPGDDKDLHVLMVARGGSARQW